MAERFMPFIKEWYPILGVVAAGLIAWGFTQARIESIIGEIDEIKAGAEREVRQWQKIGNNAGEIATHEQRIKEIERHIDPGSVMEYGALKSMVAEDHRLLIEHLRQTNER